MKDLKIVAQINEFEEEINRIVAELCEPSAYGSVFHKSMHQFSMPSVEALSEIIQLLRTVLFPGYFGNSELNPKTMHYYIGSTLEKTYFLLSEQIKKGFCFDCPELKNGTCQDCDSRGIEITRIFLEKLPELRKKLILDVRAAFEGDPAAKTMGEAIFC
jgi:serine O-acetyltransferase